MAKRTTFEKNMEGFVRKRRWKQIALKERKGGHRGYYEGNKDNE
jgi:hypothetical protein